jgi:hypothetical protein
MPRLDPPQSGLHCWQDRCGRSSGLLSPVASIRNIGIPVPLFAATNGRGRTCDLLLLRSVREVRSCGIAHVTRYGL